MHRIILDTDPGIDDALALFLALASPEVEVAAVTTVSGNVSVDLTTQNALTLLTLAGRTDIPVARGSALPLLRPPVDAAYVHGRNGLGDVAFPRPQIEPVHQHAVDLIVETIMQAPGTITLVPVGPLTNIALALRREPRIAQAVREVVIMGGALRVPGNITPAAEFNIYADPHAAHIVFHAGWPIRLVSLDVTEQVMLRREHIATLARSNSPVTMTLQQILTYPLETFAPMSDIPGFQMHDPLCLAAVFQPDLITWQPAHVDVELTGTLTLGETVAHFPTTSTSVNPTNIQASVAVDAERFLHLYLERIRQAFS